jgi:hypothetical protein
MRAPASGPVAAVPPGRLATQRHEGRACLARHRLPAAARLATPAEELLGLYPVPPRDSRGLHPGTNDSAAIRAFTSAIVADARCQ